jgi:hypothetical protein
MGTMDYWGYLLIGGGIVLLGLLIFLFGNRLRPLGPEERRRSEEAARENWGKEKVR